MKSLGNVKRSLMIPVEKQQPNKDNEKIESARFCKISVPEIHVVICYLFKQKYKIVFNG
jgi:hypothetical protein